MAEIINADKYDSGTFQKIISVTNIEIPLERYGSADAAGCKPLLDM